MIDYTSVQLKERTGSSVSGSGKAMTVTILLLPMEAIEGEWIHSS